MTTELKASGDQRGSGGRDFEIFDVPSVNAAGRNPSPSFPFQVLR